MLDPDEVRADVAFSEHPVATRSVGECAGRLLDHGFRGASLLVVCATRSFQGTMTEIATAFDSLVDPAVSIAFATDQILVGGRPLSSGSGIAAMALSGLECAAVPPDAGKPLSSAIADVVEDLPSGFCRPAATTGFVIVDTDGSPLVDPVGGSPGGWSILGIRNPSTFLNGNRCEEGGAGVLVENGSNLPAGAPPVPEGTPAVVAIAPFDTIANRVGHPARSPLAALGFLDGRRASLLSGGLDGDAGGIRQAGGTGPALGVSGCPLGLGEGHSSVYLFRPPG